jgi:threonine dehydrogenase-like Zn-dependent dehydrogenase
MKVLVYHGAKAVRIDDKRKPEIKDREDIILRLTSAALCGSSSPCGLKTCVYI